MAIGCLDRCINPAEQVAVNGGEALDPGIKKVAERVQTVTRARLEVVRIEGRQELHRVLRAVQAWSAIAGVEVRKTQDSQRQSVLEDSLVVNTMLVDHLRKMLEEPHKFADHQVYACLEPDRRIQGVMSLSPLEKERPSCLWIDYLVTDPYNLIDSRAVHMHLALQSPTPTMGIGRSHTVPIPGFARQMSHPPVREVGRSLIREATVVAASKGYSELGLNSTDSARGFYRTCGFSFNKEEASDWGTLSVERKT